MKDNTSAFRDELRSADQPWSANTPKPSQDRMRESELRMPRSSESRPSTTASTPVGPIRMGGRYSALNALYEPMFKPYSFSHMYNTKYKSDFQGRYCPPASPERAETANFATIKYRYGTTTYQQHYQNLEPFTGAFVVPYSRHRKNKPQPNMKNVYNYPNQVKLGIQAPKRSYVFIAGPQDDRPLTRRVINSVIEGCLAACSILGRGAQDLTMKGFNIVQSVVFQEDAKV